MRWLFVVALLWACGGDPSGPDVDPLEAIPSHTREARIRIQGSFYETQWWYEFTGGRYVYAGEIVGGRRILESIGSYWIGEYDAALGYTVGLERDRVWFWDFEEMRADTTYRSVRWSMQIVPRLRGVEIDGQEYEYR